MKKLLLSSVIFITFFTAIHSQEQNQFTKNQTTFGFKGGLNQSYISANNTPGYQGLEFYGGFFSETRLSEKWSFQNELLFSFTDDYHFIEVPLFLKYNFNEKLSLFVGPKLDFLVDEVSDGEKFDPLGLSLEIGVQYNFAKRFFVEGRYGYSFTNQVDFGEFYSGARRTLRFGVGYKF